MAPTKGAITNFTSTANATFAIVLIVLILLSCFGEYYYHYMVHEPVRRRTRNKYYFGQPCDELYVVGPGETLYSIMDKCGDPYIVENNPHIHDPDEIIPGLVIKITPLRSR